MAQRPSSIPAGGQPLSSEEQAAFERAMASIVLGSHLFKSLDETGRQELLASGFVLRFEPGEVLVRQGEPGDTMFVVLEGQVRVETETPSGTLQLAELGVGACLGEVSVLTRAPRTATVSALGPVTTVSFGRHRIERLLAAHPRVRLLLEALVEGRARDTVEKIVGGH